MLSSIVESHVTKGELLSNKTIEGGDYEEDDEPTSL
jgi:hypothetical protein